MEVTINDLKHLKLSPSLIIFLKAIHLKDDSYLQELNKVSELTIMAKHLEKLNIIKIVSNELSSESFEIRKIGMISYLNKLDDKDVLDEQIDEVIDYFKKVTGKLRVSNNSSANRKFIKSRLTEYNIQDLKDVIDLKYKQWNSDTKRLRC